MAEAFISVCSFQECLHLLDAADEKFALIIGVRPLDLVTFEYAFDERVGITAVLFIEKVRSPLSGQAIISLKPKTVAVNLHRAGDMGDIDSADVIVRTPLEVGFPELVMIAQPLPDLVDVFFMHGGDTPLIIVPGKRVFGRSVRGAGLFFKVSDLAFGQINFHFLFSDRQQPVDVSGVTLVGQVEFGPFQGPVAMVKVAEVLGIGAVGLQFQKAASVQHGVPFRRGATGIAVKP